MLDSHEFCKVGEDKRSLLEKIDFLRKDGLHSYQNHVQELFGIKKVPKWNYDKLTELTIYKSYSDKNKKETDPKQKYHLANALCFLRVTQTIFDDDFRKRLIEFDPNKKGDLLIVNYIKLLKHLLWDAVFILDVCESKKCSVERSFFRSETMHPFDFFLLLEQSIFGQYSFHSYSDKSENLSMAVIRMMIESRLRRAFDYYGTIDRASGQFRELPMADLFDVLSKSSQKHPAIDFLKKSPNLERIYQWTCLYIHGGHRDLTWKPIVVMNYLRDIMTHTVKGNSTSVDYGIAMPRRVLEDIRDLLKEKVSAKNDDRLELYSSGAFELYIEEP